MKLIALLALILGLIGAHSQEVKNVFEFKRALDTCDKDGDFVIKKSGPTKVVFAMGSSDPEGNTLSASEFSNPDIIGTKDIDFFAKSKKASALAPAAIKSRAKEEKPLKDAKSLVVMASDIHVPANLTTYYFCAIRNFEMNDLKENLQIIRAQAFLGGNKAAMEEEESGVNEKAIVTNFALYACPPGFDVAEENETISSSNEQQQQFNLSEPIIPDANFTMTSDGAQGDCIGMPRRYLKCVRSPVALWSIRGGSPDLPENVGIPLNTSGTFVLKIRIDNLAESAQMLANNLKEEMPVKESAEKEESNETSSTSGHVQAHVISKLNDTKQGYGFRIWYTDKPREQESSFFEMAAVKLLHFPMGNLTSQSSNTTESESSETSEKSEKEKPLESESESAENVGEQSILSAVCPAQCVQGLPEEGVTVFQLNLLGLSKMRVRLIRDGKEISLLADQERLNLDSMADIKTKTVLKEPVKIKNGDILITTCVFEEDELDTPEIDSLDICMATLQYYPRVPSFLFCASMPFHNVTTLKSSNLTMAKNASEESESESNKTASAEESSHQDLPSWLFPQIAFCAKVNETIPKDALLQPKLLLKHIQPVMIKTPPVFTAKEKSNETESESSETKEKENQGFFDDEQMAEGDQESEWQGDQDQEEQEMGLDLEDEYAGLSELDLEGLEFEDDEEGTKLTMGKCIRPAMPHSTVLSSGKKAIGHGENDTGHMHLHAFTNSEKLDDEGKMRLLWRCEASKKTCQFAVEAETKGWVAIGFKEKGDTSETKKDALKKADFAVAWITDDKDLHFIDMNTLKSDSPKVDDSQDFYDIRGIESSDIEKFTTHAAAAPGKNTTAIKENIKNATQPVPPAQTATGQTGPVPSQTGTTGRHQKGSASRSTEASFSVLLSFAVGWLAVVLAM